MLLYHLTSVIDRFTYFCNNSSGNSLSTITEHKSSKIFVIFVQFNTNWSVGMDYHLSIGIFCQTSTKTNVCLSAMHYGPQINKLIPNCHFNGLRAHTTKGILDTTCCWANDTFVNRKLAVNSGPSQFDHSFETIILRTLNYSELPGNYIIFTWRHKGHTSTKNKNK